MDVGVSIFFTDYSITPAGLAMALEERGFDSVWAAEHSHIPVPRKTRADQELGKIDAAKSSTAKVLPSAAERTGKFSRPSILT